MISRGSRCFSKTAFSLAGRQQSRICSRYLSSTNSAFSINARSFGVFNKSGHVGSKNTISFNDYDSTYKLGQRYRWQSTAAAVETGTDEEKTKFVSTPEREYEFFENVNITDSGVAIIKIDCFGKKVNTISFKLADEAKEIFAKYEHDDRVKAVVVMSSKPDNFIVGADIFDIKNYQDESNSSKLVDIIEDGIHFFEDKIRDKPQPVVCAINGQALGGGLEWAMWCDYRICTDHPKTVMGLPEVKLGLLPGFGGTQNLPKLVGLQAAMEMMLMGKNVYPRKAKKLGLVDLVVDADSLEEIAIETALKLASGELKRKPKKKSLKDKLIEDNPIGRHFVWQEVKKLVDKNSGGHYPSPYKIIDCVKYGIENNSSSDMSKGLKNEREEFAKLATTPESASLISIFEGMTSMKKHKYGKDAAVDVKTVAVIGAGLMGAGIAQISAQKHYNVLLKDQTSEALNRGVEYMQKDWNKRLKKKAISKFDYNKYTSNIVPLSADSYNDNWEDHFKNTDLIIEAVFEDITLKKKVIADCEKVIPEHCIFATNTSAIPITQIAEGAKRPQNIVGMHYFSPVPLMPLLEIIPHEGTSDEAIATAYEVGAKQGKTCIVVKDVPGFYVNRCLGPYITEICGLAADGVDLEYMDKCLKKFGMPVGPVTLLDEVGIDVSLKVGKFLLNADLGTRLEGGEIGIVERMVEEGYLGKKSLKGFYTYPDKKKGEKKKKYMSDEVKGYAKQYMKRDLKLSEKEIQDRMVCRLVNEAAKCLEDEIIANPTVGDIGMVFGTGFAPFRGGPFRYLDSVGVSGYVDMMMGFRDKYGIQFEPCDLLQDYAKSGKKFFPQ